MTLPRSHVSDASSSSSSAIATHRLYQVWRGRNKFLCGGRLVFGPDANSLVLSVSLIMTPLALFLAFISFHLADLMGKPLGPFVPATAMVVGAFDVIALVLTSGRDPGIIPRNTRPPDPDDVQMDGAASSVAGGGASFSRTLPPTRDVCVNGKVVKVKYCQTCMLYRPPRCSHCSVCNNCVERFDHHCPWVGQCIGKRNYRFFFMFISSTTFLCLYIFGFSWVNLILLTRHHDCSLGSAVVMSPVSALLIVYTFFTAWFVGGLTTFHSYLICTNKTTYENFRYRYEAKHNPYNRGVALNIAEIFLSPIPASKNDFRAKVTVDPNALYGPPSMQYTYSIRSLSSASKMSFNTKASHSFDMGKASFNLNYTTKRTSIGSSDIYGAGAGADGSSSLQRCATDQPRHSVFGAGARRSKTADDVDQSTATELDGAVAGQPGSRPAV